MKKLYFLFAQTLISSLLFVAGAFANTLTLDPTFNGTGYNIQPAVTGSGRSNPRSMALQADGKIVVGGNTVVDQQPRDFVLMRFKTDGTLDASFGTNGVLTTHIGLQDVDGKVSIQPDGKILLGGTVTTNEASTEFGVIRYHPDGMLDASFNSTALF